MHEWVNLLRSAVESTSPAVMVLATLSRNGSPRARSVVCRTIDDDGTIWFVSDSRTAKSRQIKLDRRVETVLWFANLRRQFRIRGEARVVLGSDRRARQMWQALPDATRAMFTWPSPGDPLAAADAFAASLSADSPSPQSFEAIAIHPTLVEELDLNPHPHRRTRWRRKKQWAAERINP
jgi:pyridoxamine 5'-phosphate oxidase